jgi:hypothetical protein
MIAHAPRVAAAPVLLLGLLAAALPAHALQMEWGTGATLELTDNVTRAPAQPRSEQIGILWAGVWLREDTPTLRLGLSSTVEYRDYQRGTFDDENLFDLAAMMTASLIPQRLHWHLENYFQQIRLTDLDPLTPDNRQDSNVFWTGPDVFFRFGPSTDLQLGARAGHHYYSRSDADNYRIGASSRLTRRMRPRLDGFVHLETLRVEYEDSAWFSDYKRLDALAGVDYFLRTTDIRLEGGHTWIDRDDATTLEGFLGALRITRRLPADAAAGVVYTRRFTDAGATLLAAGADPMRAERVTRAVPRGLVYEHRAELFYTRQLGMIDTRVAAFWQDEEVRERSGAPDIFEEDRRMVGGRVDLGYRINIEWLLAAYLSYRNSDYPQIGREDDDWLIGARAEYRLSRHFTTGLELLRNERISNLPEEEFTENVVLISLRYGERPPAVPL